ncbi:MAG: pantoate kinase [Candidatus Methanomethylicaceae archaeon]
MQVEGLTYSTTQSEEAYAPGHITGFFKVHISDNPLLTGSTGAGICLEAGVTTRVTIKKSNKPEFTLLWNGLPMHEPKVCKSVLRRIIDPEAHLSIVAEQSSLLPINYGYGMSGASALSLALAINKALGSPMPITKVGDVAHFAEVENLTGLGDVSAQMVGGFEIRLAPGAPTVGMVKRLLDHDEFLIITTPVKPISTKRMISINLKRINEQGDFAMSAFMKSPTLETFINLSRGFWERLLPMDAKMAMVMKKYESLGIPFVSLKKGLVYGMIHEDEVHKVLGRISQTPSNLNLPILIHDRSSDLSFIVSRLSSRGAN